MNSQEKRLAREMEGFPMKPSLESRQGVNGTREYRLVDDVRKVRTPWMTSPLPETLDAAERAMNRALEPYMRMKVLTVDGWTVVYSF